MKRIIILFLFVALYSTQIFAQTIPPTDIANNFKAKFPKVKGAVWQKNQDGSYQAKFALNGKKAEAKYDAKGNWQATEVYLNPDELEPKVKNYIEQKYPNCQFKKVLNIELANHNPVYGILIHKETQDLALNFDNGGNLLQPKEAKKIYTW